MQKKISKLPFRGTAEQEKKLREVIDANKHDKSLLMAVMQQAQDIYGYLPMEVQTIIAEEMDVPLEKVYGVATFYAQFSLSPKGEYNISVCLGTACYVKGSGDIFNRLSEKLGIGADECTPDGRFWSGPGDRQTRGAAPRRHSYGNKCQTSRTLHAHRHSGDRSQCRHLIYGNRLR